MSKTKVIIKNPIWSFVGTALGISVFFGFGVHMITHTLVQYSILAIALLLAVHGSYRLWKQKTIRDIMEPINTNDFDTIENPGVAIHKKSKEIFCLKCLLQKNIKSPLIIDHSKGYMCRNCEDIVFHLDNWEEFMKFSKEWRLKTT